MDKIWISAHDVAPFDNFADGVTGLRVLFVNVFAISTGAKWALVDTGLAFSEPRIRIWIRDHFNNVKPSCILLTHGHFDHAGNLEKFAAGWDIPVYVHQLELPYVTGALKYPPPDPTVGGGALAWFSALYPRGPVNVGDRALALPVSGEVPGFDEWRWIHTPGHTDGHVAFFREADRVLIAGDAFVTTKQESIFAVARQRPELHGPPAYYTSDWDAARDSVRRLAALRPLTVGTGHGRPMEGPGVPDALNALAERFDRVARPQHGRYVTRPAA